MLNSVYIFYFILAAAYVVIRIYSKRLTEQKLRSRSEIAIWIRDFDYKLNWVFLPLILLPGIALLVYFLCFEKLVRSEILMYIGLFFFYGFFVNKGIVKLMDLHKHYKSIAEKPDYIKKIRTGNTAEG